jgi:hypothetical protein
MPGPAGLEPIRRKAAAPLIEEQRTQNGRTLHSAPRVKLNATARPVGMARRNPAGRHRAAGTRPALYQLVYTNLMIGLDHVAPGISTDSARGPKTTGNNWDDSDKTTREGAAPLTSGTARLPRSTIGIFAGQGYRTSSPVTARPMISL